MQLNTGKNFPLSPIDKGTCYEKKNYVLDLLISLRGIHYDNYQIVVVDNASTDGSVETIRSQFPNVDLIVNSKNLGGTGGFNTGIRYVLKKGGFKYVWLLDNDAEVEDGSSSAFPESLNRIWWVD